MQGGQAQRTCTIPGCETKHYARGYCGKHYKRWRAHGDPNIIKESSGTRGKSMPHGELSNGWRGDSITYNGMHKRLRGMRGRASAYVCDCGKPAQNWAYDGSDPNPRIEKLLVYSTDVNKYIPRCISCHLRNDGVQPTKAAHDAGRRSRRIKAKNKTN